MILTKQIIRSNRPISINYNIMLVLKCNHVKFVITIRMTGNMEVFLGEYNLSVYSGIFG